MKSKYSLEKVVKYIRELSIIVTGIAITIGMGFLVNNNNNKKDQKQYLNAIKIELESNARMFDWAVKWIEKSVKYAEYISTHDSKSLNKDTLAYYAYTDNDGLGYAFSESMSARFPTNAFEMFKISGAMRQIKDKELLQEIWHTYTQIDAAKQNIDRIMQIKEREALKYEDMHAKGKKIDVPMLTFHKYGYPYELVRHCQQTSEAIKELLAKFE